MTQVPGSSRSSRRCLFRDGFETQTARLPGDLSTQTNEHYLLSGVPCSTVPLLVQNGADERFSGSNAGTMFGEGVYFAEDGAKIDQYVGSPDVGNDATLRNLLFSDCDHPAAKEAKDAVHYVFIC
jgi:hypothetical protein